MAGAAGKLLLGLALTGLCAAAFAQTPPKAPIPDEVPPGEVKGSAPTPPGPKEPLPPAEPLKVEAVPEGKQPATKPPPTPSATRPRFPIAVVQVVDKITTETNRFELRLDRPLQYKSLIFTLHACEGSAPSEPDPDYVAHLSVDFQPPAPPGRAKPPRKAVFRGWMYASSPSITPFEQPTYDAWLVSCKSDAPPPSPTSAAPAAGRAPPTIPPDN